MHVRSLGWRTDLIFPAFDGEIHDRGDHLVVRTPTSPGFFWGNYLLYRHPPGPGDLARWKAAFAREIGVPPGVRHIALGWDSVGGESGAVQPFLEDGFELQRGVVLSARDVRVPPRVRPDVVVRPLREDEDWERALEMQILCQPPGHRADAYRAFRGRQLARARRMVGAGLGRWFGAFLGDGMVGSLGLFGRAGLGRFQDVETHPEFRRRGVCSTLVHAASRHGLRRMGLRTLVLVADEGEPADGIYRSVGFEPVELQASLEKWDRGA
jgi:ribosomal protein S18 acetylase RimI-like enzyme